MVAYFVRRLVGGAIMLVAAWLVIYSALVYVPGGPLTPIREGCFTCTPSSPRALKAQNERHLKLDKPWPISYFMYLFDTRDCCIDDFDNPERSSAGLIEHRGISISVNGVPIAGRGALTGDFGDSLIIERDTPVTDLFGPGLGELLLVVTAAIFLLMAIAVAQRLRRPPPYTLTPHPTPLDRPRPLWVT
jgi:ABC-type dipeptide/oligopeptide/nickel transport system permease component